MKKAIAPLLGALLTIPGMIIAGVILIFLLVFIGFLVLNLFTLVGGAMIVLSLLLTQGKITKMNLYIILIGVALMIMPYVFDLSTFIIYQK